MGKIKSKQVKRYSEEILEKGIDFTEEFDRNKKILGDKMPSKRMRNQMAGYLSRFIKHKKKEAEKLKAE
jgi:ribosomal protein S17E